MTRTDFVTVTRIGFESAIARYLATAIAGARFGSLKSWSFWIRSLVKCSMVSVTGSSVAQGACP
jgi:hypothetical protein